ncbi:MAG: hypothetical protein WC832_11525, partial [Anaerolineales bacterium]
MDEDHLDLRQQWLERRRLQQIKRRRSNPEQYREYQRTYRQRHPKSKASKRKPTIPDHPKIDYKNYILGSLTRELRDTKSPVRWFFNDRFGETREVARRYRDAAGLLRVPGNSANAGTVGTAVDWLLRFLLHPRPDTELAKNGAVILGPAMVRAYSDLTAMLEATAVVDTFTGPTAASSVDAKLLARGCWALALLTEVFRAGLWSGSPLASCDLSKVTAKDLLAMADKKALVQLARLRKVIEDNLIPQLSTRAGTWVL